MPVCYNKGGKNMIYSAICQLQHTEVLPEEILPSAQPEDILSRLTNQNFIFEFNESAIPVYVPGQNEKIPDFLLRKNPGILLFGGKGGTGKTTTAVASALYLSRNMPDKRILLASTDPAHSVGDSLEVELTGEPLQIQGFPNLFAAEFDSEKLLAKFKQTAAPILTEIARRGTFFEQNEIKGFFDLSLPGMDELAAILEIMNLARRQTYHLILLDTAPTGHTIRLIELPGHMRLWLKALNSLLEKHRILSKTFSGSYKKDECDLWLENTGKDLDMIESLLRDVHASEFVPVTIPEDMAVSETIRLVEFLEKSGISVKTLVVNRVVDGDNLCGGCKIEQFGQLEQMARIAQVFSNLRQIIVPRFPSEIKGIKSLETFAGFLSQSNHHLPTSNKSGSGDPSYQLPASIFQLPSSNLRLPSSDFVMIGGKGGVGKTTIAAATALLAASQFPDKKILILSMDPAHSLSDSFLQEIGDQETLISGFDNLWAREIDATHWLDEFKRQYRESIEEAFSGLLSAGDLHLDASLDREAMQNLLDASPPGLDEMISLANLMENLEERRFDRFILDTAPTGHFIRLLQTPEIVKEWLSSAVRLLIKYRGIINVEGTFWLILKYARLSRKLKNHFLNPEKSEVITVTIPEAMSVVETERLLDKLKKLKMTCRQLVFNMMAVEGGCALCAPGIEKENEYLIKIVAKHPELTIATTPRFSHPIQGVTELIQIGKQLYGDAAGKEFIPK
jgi:arsenite/tail-anchored protein-transporting ATPase